MSDDRLIEQILNTWQIHNGVNLYLLDNIPKKGFEAVPLSSEGRNVAQVFAHIHHVRLRWLEYNAAEVASKVPRFHRRVSPSGAKLKAALRASGRAVEALLRGTLQGRGRIKAFNHQPVRWMAYLISHESHHRGQIVLALKQCGMRLPRKVAIAGLWEQWYWGKP